MREVYYDFFEVDSDNPFTGYGCTSITLNITTNGYNYSQQTEELLFTAEYFLSGDIRLYTTNSYNLMNLLATFGGMVSILFKLTGFLGRNINKNFLKSKLLRAMYFA